MDIEKSMEEKFLVKGKLPKREQKPFSKFFREKGIELKKHEQKRDSASSLYPQEKVAERLGISIEQLHNKLYRKRKKKLTREWVIAICAAYGLDACETSTALSYCDMPTLDDESKREGFIVNYLNEHKFKPSSIDKFNSALIGAELSPLDISFRGRKNEKIWSKEKSTYEEYRQKEEYIYGCGYDNNHCNSLMLEYRPNMRCIIKSFVKNNNNQKYILEASSDGQYYIWTEGKDLPEILDEIEETSEFYSILIESSILAKKRIQKLNNILNDSKNYRGRYSANLKEDKIHVFYEEFNYICPERNEYLLMEYWNGKYILSVSSKSMFMEEYLSLDEYNSNYNAHEKSTRKIFDSLEKIDDFCNDELKFNMEIIDIKTERKNAYIRLKKLVKEKLNAIREGKIHILNNEYIFEIPYEVLTYYHVEKEFKCTYDKEFEEINYAADYADFIDNEGNEIRISLEEIFQAFDLGIPTIEDICRIKREKGSISSVLE